MVSSSHPSKKLLPLPLSNGDQKIVPADSVRNLRMILDSHLTLELHVKKVWVITASFDFFRREII